jgi:hypothetical protein
MKKGPVPIHIGTGSLHSTSDSSKNPKPNTRKV